MDNNRKVVELLLDDVLPNRFQPRIKFNEESINELAESIKEHGVIQPIVVRPVGDRYEIIAGERRYKATTLAGLQTIPAIITNLNDKDSAEVALIENVQRQDLTPIEEAISYKKILDMGYLTQENLAEKLGKTQSTIANKLRLLNLDEEVQEALLNEKISERHARSLLKLSNYEDQVKLLNKIISERLTVRKTDEEIVKMLNNQDEIKDNGVEVIDWDAPIIIPEENNMPSMIEEATNKEQPAIETQIDQNNFFNFNIPTTPIVEENIGFANNSFVEQPINIPNIPQSDSIEDNQSSPVFDQSFNFFNPQNVEEQFNIPTTPAGEENLNDNQTILQDNFLNQPFNENLFNNFSEEDNNGSGTQFNENNFFDLIKDEIPVESQETSLNDVNYDFSNMFKNETSQPAEEFNFSSNFGIPNFDISSTISQPNIQESQLEQPATNTFFTGDIKTAINTIRTCTDTIEKYGFVVDSEEYDLEDIYQVVIKIQKK